MRDPKKYRKWLTIGELPPGAFFIEKGNRSTTNLRHVGFKTEYHDKNGDPICYCIESGERYWGRAPQNRPLAPRLCREWTPSGWYQGETHWARKP